MTQKASTARLILYVIIAMLTSASAGIATVDFENAREMVQFALSVVTTGMITARSYIDQTPTQIDPKP
jgi:hypothetical protein